MSHKNRSILIASASDANRHQIAKLLSVLDPLCEIVKTKTGAASITALDSGRADLVFIDDQFPDMSGADVQSHLKTKDSDCLTIALAEAWSLESVQRCRDLGIYDCLVSPVSRQDLQRVLQRRKLQNVPLATLVVDDARTMRRVILKVLGECHFDLPASEADSSEMALSLCKTIPYTFIFMDYNMPGYNGLESAVEVLKMQPNCRIVLMSSVEDAVLIDEAKASGLAGFLKKPFYPDDIDRLLHTLLGLSFPNILNPDFLESLKAPAQDQEEHDVFLL